ncbi:hypothetical protein GTY54_25880 [Streptomyces sp. SID625]|nr:hypothetical protein [Streptomyces sp. SID625]
MPSGVFLGSLIATVAEQGEAYVLAQRLPHRGEVAAGHSWEAGHHHQIVDALAREPVHD